MQQFSIAIDDDAYEGLREMARIARRHYREQAAILVERAVRQWQQEGRDPSAAMLEPKPDSVAA